MSKEKLHKEDIPVCVQLRGAGVLDKDIAAYIGVDPATFSVWVNHPKTENQRELSKALKKAETNRKNNLLVKLHQAAQDPKHWQAAAWLLERQYPEEFARPEVQLQREAMRESTEQLVQGFESVVVKIKEAAYRGNQTDA